MVTLQTRPGPGIGTPAATYPPLADAPGGRPFDATALLTIVAVLLVALPSRLVFKPLGAAGTPAEIFGFLLLIVWSTSRLMPTERRFDAQPIRRALALLALAILVSYVAGATRPASGEEMSSADRGLLSLCAWSGMALIGADGIRDRERLDTFLRRLVLAGAFLATLGIVQFATGANPIGTLHVPGLAVNAAFGSANDRSDFRRVSGTALHPIEFGVVLVLILPIALHFAMASSAGTRVRSWVPTLLIAGALPMAVARSAILGLIVMLLVLVPTWTRGQRRWALLMVPAFAVALRLLIPGLLGTITSLFTHIGSDPSTQGRTGDYSAAAHFVSRAPITGRGFFTFIPSIYRTLDNQYLGTLIEVGLLGLCALLGLLLTGAFAARGGRRRSTDRETRQLGQALTASCASAVLSFATFDALSFPMCAAMLFVILGCVGAFWRLTGGPREADRPRPEVPAAARRRARLVAAALVGVVLLPVTVLEHGKAPTYNVESTVVLEPAATPHVNPYEYSSRTEVLTRVTRVELLARTGRRGVAALGGTADYEVAQGDQSAAPFTDAFGFGPVLHLIVRSTSLASAELTRVALVTYLGSLLQTDQQRLGVPANIQVQPTPTAVQDQVTIARGSPKRVYAGLVLLAFAAWTILARLLARHRRFRGHGAVPVPA